MGSFPYLPDIGRFIVRGGGGFAYGGGYAPVGNNPNTFSSGLVAERVADIAEGGNNTIYVGFQPLDPGDPENLPPLFAGFTGWAWGKDADQIKSDLVHAGIAAVVDHPLIYFIPLPVKLNLLHGFSKVPIVEGTVKKSIVPLYTYTKHARDRMLLYAITDKMVNVVVRKGARYYDPKNKSIVYYLAEALVDPRGKGMTGLTVAQNPYSRRVTTVFPCKKPKEFWMPID